VLLFTQKLAKFDLILKVTKDFGAEFMLWSALDSVPINTNSEAC